MPDDDNIKVEITDDRTAHCFRLTFKPKRVPAVGWTFQPPDGITADLERDTIEIYLHATQLVDLVYRCCRAHNQWMNGETSALLDKLKQYADILDPLAGSAAR